MIQTHWTPPRNERGITLQHIIVGVVACLMVFGIGILGSVVWQTWLGDDNVAEEASAEASDFFAEVSAPTTTTTEAPYTLSEPHEIYDALQLINNTHNSLQSGIKSVKQLADLCGELTPEMSIQLIAYCYDFFEFVVEAPTKTQIQQAQQETQTG